MSYLDWHVVMQVVCIDDYVDPEQPPHPVPAIGAVCTLERIYVAHDGEVMVELVEFPSPETEDWYAGFVAKDFRPLVQRKTDISIFTRMLNPSKQRVDA